DLGVDPLYADAVTSVDQIVSEAFTFLLCGTGPTEPELDDMRLCGVALEDRSASVVLDFAVPDDHPAISDFEQRFWFLPVDAAGVFGEMRSADSVLDLAPPEPAVILSGPGEMTDDPA